MAIKIITDSGCDLSKEQALKYNIDLIKVPLTLQIGNSIYLDDENLDVLKYTKDMNSHKEMPKTAAPSPETYMNAYKGIEDIFVVTISSKLSGSYSSAELGKKLFKEENENKFIHVFDSFGASCGQALIVLKIKEFFDKGLNNEEIITAVEKFVSTQRTYFILEKLDNLVKTGRLTQRAAMLASILSIKPILGNDTNGNLRLIDKARGIKKATERLSEIMKIEGTPTEDKILAITHCNNLERALQMQDIILSKMKFKDILIMEATGLVTNYAQEFGVILSF